MMPRLLKQLAEHNERVANAHRHASEIEAAAHHAQTEVTRLNEVLSNAIGVGDVKAAEQATRDLTRAKEVAAEPWTARVQGAQQAVRRAESERWAWRTQHVRELVQELTPAANAKAKALTGAVAQVVAAHREWHAVRDEMAEIIAGTPMARTIPFLGPADEAVRLLRRDAGQIPSPAPVLDGRGARVLSPAEMDLQAAVEGKPRMRTEPA